MVKVNFYALKESNARARVIFACRLANKVNSLGHSLHIHVDTPQQTRYMDDLLWQFFADSFLPHSTIPLPPTEKLERITIGSEAPPTEEKQVLINLGKAVCDYHRAYARINEIILADEESLKLGRERFSYYREQNYELETLKI